MNISVKIEQSKREREGEACVSSTAGTLQVGEGRCTGFEARGSENIF